jgi:glucose/arabinose dehydrogenase
VVCLLLLAFIGGACGRSKPPSTRRVVKTPLASVNSTSPSPAASATAAPTPTRATHSSGVLNAPRTPAPDLATASIKLTKLATFDQPVAMALRTKDANTYVVQKSGTVKQFRDGTIGATVLDVSREISTSSEQGLLGLAFSTSGNKMYVYFTSAQGDGAAGDDVLREYSFVNGRAVASSARDILRIADPYSNHNGGNIAFGPDGYLYVGLGDGGSGGDPENRAQNLDEPLGKMLRLDPSPSSGKPYTVPTTNPYRTSSGYKPLVWASGLRNPWRWSFDRVTKDLWIGDVGQDQWEEIDFQPANSRGGDNYGWNLMEGNHSYRGSPPAGYHRPIYEFSHASGNCSVTGGYVYRGSKIRNLWGAYVFGDFCAGELRAFILRNNAATNSRFLGVRVASLSSFGQDASGELYALSLDGPLYRIDPA